GGVCITQTAAPPPTFPPLNKGGPGGVCITQTAAPLPTFPPLNKGGPVGVCITQACPGGVSRSLTRARPRTASDPPVIVWYPPGKQPAHLISPSIFFLAWK